MAAPDITALPDAPSRSDDPTTFSTKADAFVGALPTFGTELNAAAVYANTQALAAATSETNSAASEDTAAGHVTTALGHANDADGHADRAEAAAADAALSYDQQEATYAAADAAKAGYTSGDNVYIIADENNDDRAAVYSYNGSVLTLEYVLINHTRHAAAISQTETLINLSTIRQNPNYAIDPEGAEFIPPSKLDVTRATVVVFDKDGTARQAPANGLDLTYDENGVASFPVYAEHTQSLLHIQDLSNAVWVKSNSPVITQDQIDIFGNANTAWMIEDNTTSYAGVTQTVAISSGSNPHTFLIAYKLNSHAGSSVSGVSCLLTGGTTIDSAYHINDSTGELVLEPSKSAATSAESVVSGGWALIRITQTDNASGNTAATITITAARAETLGGSPSAAAQGSAVFDVPCIFLNTSIPYPPIVTTTAAVTRADDTITSIFNYTPAFTWVVDFYLPVAGEGPSGAETIARISDESATVASFIHIYASDSTTFRLRAKSGGTSIISDVDHTVATVAGRHRLVFSYSDSGISAAVDGVLIAEGVVPSIPITSDLDIVLIGASTVGGAMSTFDLNLFNTYAAALTDAQCLALSTIPQEV